VSVSVTLPGPLRPLAAGQSKVVVEGAPKTVAEALEGLWAAHPALRLRVVDEQGRVRPHVNVFVERDNIRDTGGLATPLAGGETIAILPAVSGG
jgi:molybdopterin converting factor small subunit